MPEDRVTGWVVLCPVCKQWVVSQIPGNMAVTPDVDPHADRKGRYCPGSGQRAEEMESLTSPWPLPLARPWKREEGWAALCPVCKQWVIDRNPQRFELSACVEPHLDQADQDCPGSTQRAQEVKPLGDEILFPVARQR